MVLWLWVRTQSSKFGTYRARQIASTMGALKFIPECKTDIPIFWLLGKSKVTEKCMSLSHMLFHTLLMTQSREACCVRTGEDTTLPVAWRCSQTEVTRSRLAGPRTPSYGSFPSGLPGNSAQGITPGLQETSGEQIWACLRGQAVWLSHCQERANPIRWRLVRGTPHWHGHLTRLHSFIQQNFWRAFMC